MAWERNLSRPVDGLMDDPLEISQQRELGRVTDRLAALVGPHREVQADDGARPREEHHVEVRKESSLETALGGG